MKYMLLSLVLFLSGCSPYLMSNKEVMPGDTKDEVISAWGQPFEINRIFLSGNNYETWTYGLQPSGYVDYRTYLIINNGRVVSIRGYKVDD